MNIVEKMEMAYRQMVCARPVGAGDGDTYTVEPPTPEQFRKAVLTATGLTEAQLEGLANGTMVVVPKEPDEAMLEAGNEMIQDGREWGKQTSAWAVWEAMLAAKEG